MACLPGGHTYIKDKFCSPGCEESIKMSSMHRFKCPDCNEYTQFDHCWLGLVPLICKGCNQRIRLSEELGMTSVYGFICTKCGVHFQIDSTDLRESCPICDKCLGAEMTKKKDISGYEKHEQKTFNGNTDLEDTRKTVKGGTWEEILPGVALRYNEGKVQYSMIDLGCFEYTARVLEFGAKKYARDNWRKGMKTSSIIDSLLRHIARLQAGEVIDPESGLPHLGHIGCNIMFLGNDKNEQDIQVLPNKE